MASEEQIKLCSEAGSTTLPCPWDRPAGCRLPEPISVSSLASYLPSEVVRGILEKGLVHMLGGGPGYLEDPLRGVTSGLYLPGI